ncbi:MAG: RIP metalloprotease RseP [Spirochaetota bacterium]
MTFLTYVLPALILLGLCIFVHELGHLLGGVMVGIKARTFSIGYGSGFIKKKWGDTTYQITLIPFGGFCSFYGDNPYEELKGESWEFLSAAPWRRIVTVVMGPVFNLIFGILLLFVMNLVGFQVESNRIQIPSYLAEENSPAYGAGLRTGDRIIRINGSMIQSFQDLQSKIVFSDGKPLDITVLRDGAEREFTVEPAQFRDGGHYSIGVMPYGESILVTNVLDGGAGAEAGLRQYDEVLSIDGTRIRTTEQFVDTIRQSPGKTLTFTVQRKDETHTVDVTPHLGEEITVTGFQDPRFPDSTYTIEIDRLALIKEAIADGTVSINGTTVRSFEEFIAMIEDAAEAGHSITLENRSGVYSGIFRYDTYGSIGVELALAPEMVAVQYGPGRALVRAVRDPIDFVGMNLKGIGMMITGKIDARENLSGPVRIAKIAGDTMRYRGVRDYVLLMARISIILMVMNLLPIPAVDGSHIIIYLVEMARGKPVPPAVLEKIQLVGFFIIIALGVFALWNDITQL